MNPSPDALRCICISHNSGMPFLGLWKSCSWKAVSRQDRASLSQSLWEEESWLWPLPAGSTAGLSPTDTDRSFVIFHLSSPLPPSPRLPSHFKTPVTLCKSEQDSILSLLSVVLSPFFYLFKITYFMNIYYVFHRYTVSSSWIKSAFTALTNVPLYLRQRIELGNRELILITPIRNQQHSLSPFRVTSLLWPQEPEVAPHRQCLTTYREEFRRDDTDIAINYNPNASASCKPVFPQTIAH